MRQIDGVAKDYRGVKLCDSCWNGNHYLYDRPLALPDDPKPKNPSKGAVKKSNCIGGECECPCKALLEPTPRVKKNSGEAQTAIPMDDALEIR
jgi:hypothetical protein